MSNPSFENIDRWFFEYFEGNLSPQQVEQFHHFLEVHPELELEFETWKSAYVSDEKPEFAGVAALQRSFNFTPYLVSSVAIVTLIAGLLVWNPFPTSPIYVASPIDLMRIGEETEEDFVPFSEHSPINLFMNEGEGGFDGVKELFVENKNYTAPQDLIAAPLTEARLNKNQEKPDLVAPSMAVNQELTITESKNQEGTPFGLWLSITDSKKNPYSPNYPEVRASIENSQISKLDVAFEESVLPSVGSALSVSGSSNFSRKSKSVMRKVQRMLDQPIALRNTKDPYLLVPNLTGYMSNFGMAGTMIQNRFQVTSRNQWVGRDNQQVMNTLSWDGYVRELRGGLGFDLTYNDYNYGGVRNMQMGLVYSPKFSINKNVSFEPAIRFKMGSVDLDTQSSLIGSLTEINRGNVLPMFVGDNPPTGSRLWYRDVGVGALINTKWFYAGANIDNVGRHYNNFYSSEIEGEFRASAHFSAIAGTEYKALNRELVLSTYMYYQKFDALNELWLGGNVRWRMLVAGAAVSTNLDVAGSLGLQFDHFSIHYNADMLSSVLADKRLLSHQVTARVLLKPNRHAMRIMNL